MDERRSARVAKVGRKPQGLEHVERLEGSPEAKARLKAFLQTMSGERTIPEVCAELDIGESRFHKLRGDWLQEAVCFLEPGQPGRPAKPTPSAEARQVEELERQVDEMQAKLRVADIRAELAQVMPHVVTGARAAQKKTPGQKGLRASAARGARRGGGNRAV
jgi:hypothetical protein